MGVTGYDIDGVLSIGVQPDPNGVVISGRTFAEYDDFVRQIAQMLPVYIRGAGASGDRIHAGQFKATMIQLLGVTRFYEDDELQASIIHSAQPSCEIVIISPIPLV